MTMIELTDRAKSKLKELQEKESESVYRVFIQGFG